MGCRKNGRFCDKISERGRGRGWRRPRAIRRAASVIPSIDRGPYTAGMRQGFHWRPGRARAPLRAPQRVQLMCAVCGRILIGLTPERVAVHQKDHQDATGHVVRVEPLDAER